MYQLPEHFSVCTDCLPELSLYVLKRKASEFRKPDWALPAARSTHLEAVRLNNSKNWASTKETDNISILGLLSALRATCNLPGFCLWSRAAY